MGVMYVCEFSGERKKDSLFFSGAKRQLTSYIASPSDGGPGVITHRENNFGCTRRETQMER